MAKLKGYDAGKKVSGIKRHIAVDTQGLSAQSKVYVHKIQPLGSQLCWHLTTQNRHNDGDTQDTAT